VSANGDICCGRESVLLDDRGVGVQPECPNHGTHDEQTRCHDEWGRPRAELGQNAEDQRGERAADVPLARCHSTGVVPNHGRTNVATAQARGPANDMERERKHLAQVDQL